jgi:hypothetical protein
MGRSGSFTEPGSGRSPGVSSIAGIRLTRYGGQTVMYLVTFAGASLAAFAIMTTTLVASVRRARR